MPICICLFVFAYLYLRICICLFVFAYLYLRICIFVLFDDNPNIHLVSPLGWEPGRWYLEPGSTFCQIRSYRGILLQEHAATRRLGLLLGKATLYSFTNTNTNTNTQIHNYKYANTNLQIQIQLSDHAATCLLGNFVKQILYIFSPFLLGTETMYLCMPTCMYSVSLCKDRKRLYTWECVYDWNFCVDTYDT